MLHMIAILSTYIKFIWFVKLQSIFQTQYQPPMGHGARIATTKAIESITAFVLVMLTLKRNCCSTSIIRNCALHQKANKSIKKGEGGNGIQDTCFHSRGGG